MKIPTSPDLLASRAFPVLAQALLEDAEPSGITFFSPWPGESSWFTLPQCLVDLLRDGPPSEDPAFVSSFTGCLQCLVGHWISEAQVDTLLALARDEEGLNLAGDLDIEIEVDLDGEAIALCAGYALAFAHGQWTTQAPELRDLQARDLKTAITAAHRARLATLDAPSPDPKT